MNIKVYIYAITYDRLVSMYVALSEDERLRQVAQYCRDAWVETPWVDGPIPGRPQDIVAKYFNAPGAAETLHYDTDWIKLEDFAKCQQATVIGDSVLLTPEQPT